MWVFLLYPYTDECGIHLKIVVHKSICKNNTNLAFHRTKIQKTIYFPHMQICSEVKGKVKITCTLTIVSDIISMTLTSHKLWPFCWLYKDMKWYLNARVQFWTIRQTSSKHNTCTSFLPPHHKYERGNLWLIGALQSLYFILYDFNLQEVNSLIPQNTYSIMYIFYTSRWYWSISDSTCTSESICWECESSEALIYTGR